MNYHYNNSNKDYSFDFNHSILILYQFYLFSKSYRHIYYEFNIIYINYIFIKILVFQNLIATFLIDFIFVKILLLIHQYLNIIIKN